ncbi:MAG: phosphate ABC transporter substrate-binding protein PstS [Oligoflexia bacterium]
MNFFRLLLTGLSVVGLVSGGAFASPRVSLQGAGATFPYPLYSKWFSEFQKANAGVEINYQSIGSGGGIRQLLAGTVDFGASDAPMTDEELVKAKGPVLHIPTALGAVVISYQLPGVPTGLRLTPSVVADLFLGKIQRWDDGKIVALNPGVRLPQLPVVPVYRSDGSGTTAIFTDYLAKVSPEFQSTVGAGKTVKWPTGLGGKGNEGVTGVVKQTPGAVGYVELVYAASNQLPAAKIKNQAGEFIEASVESVTAAAASVLKSIPQDFRTSITQAPGKNAYPISGLTYLLVFETTGAKAATLRQLIDWAMTTGQKIAPSLHYAPLPAELVRKVQAAAKRIH